MWRILEDATGREYRRLVDRRPHDLQLSLAPERPEGKPIPSRKSSTPYQRKPEIIHKTRIIPR
jgi:hypothetical protein